jgi:hypothetical protein
MATQIGEAKKYKCKHGCGKEYEHKGAMNIHENIHCPKKGGKEVSKNDADECKDGCSWRLLNSKDAKEAAAIQMGFKRVCTECDEVK